MDSNQADVEYDITFPEVKNLESMPETDLEWHMNYEDDKVVIYDTDPEEYGDISGAWISADESDTCTLEESI